MWSHPGLLCRSIIKTALFNSFKILNIPVTTFFQKFYTYPVAGCYFQHLLGRRLQQIQQSDRAASR